MRIYLATLLLLAAPFSFIYAQEDSFSGSKLTQEDYVKTVEGVIRSYSYSAPKNGPYSKLPELLSTSPNSKETLEMAAYLAFEQDHEYGLLIICLYGLIREPKSADLQFFLALAHQKIARNKDDDDRDLHLAAAEKSLNKVLELDANYKNGTALATRSYILAAQGKLDGAIADMKKYLPQTKDSGCYSFLATLLSKSGQFNEAAATGLKALDMEGDQIYAHTALGYIYGSNGDALLAEKHFAKARELDKRNSQSASIKKAESAAAIRASAKAAGIKPPPN